MKRQRQRGVPNLLTWAALVAVGLLVASSLLLQSNADWYSGDSFHDKQVTWYLMGLVVFAVAAVIDLRLVERVSLVAFGTCVVLLLLTSVVGTEVNHSRRWLRLGDFSLQASEMTKLGLVLALSRYLHGRKERIPGAPPPDDERYGLRGLVVPLMFVFGPVGLVILQPDLGTSILLIVVGFSMLIYEGVKGRTLATLLVVILVSLPLAWKFGGIQEYQKNRVWGWVDAAWLKYDADSAVLALNRNVQSEQAVWAIGSGQVWGQGSRSGAQSRLKHLPEMHTDMIVATFAEEQGFIGCTVLLLLFWLLIMWAYRTAHDSRDRYCALLCVGVASIIGWQVFINIGMVAGLLPIVGLPLPFLSYGGSSVLTMMASVGLVLNVAIRRGRL